MKRQTLLLSILLSGFAVLPGCAREEPAPSPLVAAGELVFKGTCKVCHAQGINGAPIIGNVKMWGERVEQGIPTLVEHAFEGYGLMPAKGGNADLTKEDITAAVTYMVEQLKRYPGD